MNITTKSLFALICIILFTSIIYIYIKYYRRETFFVAYNNANVPINKQETLDESDVIYINNMLNQYNVSGFPSTSSYIKYVRGDVPILEGISKVQNLISEKVINTLRIIFSKGTKYRGDRLIIKEIKFKSESKTEPFYDLYWKKIDNNIHCVFKMDIMNIEKGWARTFKIYLVITVDQEIIIKTISLEEFSYLLLEDNLMSDYDKYYKIENTLRLMDPFLTSGREMRITDSMKNNFNNVLKKKYLT